MGRIIGLVSEAAWGRLVRPSDKFLVYDAIRKLQSQGFIYKGCLTNRFIVADNKVRLVELNQIAWQYFREDPKKFQKYAQNYHWNQLKQLFEELDQIGPNGNNRLPLIKFIHTGKNFEECLFPISSRLSAFQGVTRNGRDLWHASVTPGGNHWQMMKTKTDPYNASSRRPAPRSRHALLFSISSIVINQKYVCVRSKCLIQKISRK